MRHETGPPDEPCAYETMADGCREPIYERPDDIESEIERQKWYEPTPEEVTRTLMIRYGVETPEEVSAILRERYGATSE